MSHSPISSDDETPEAFSFSISKKTAEGEARALQQFHADEKQKLKEKRRQKDRTLKERKAQAKSKSKVKETVLTKEHDESESKDEDGSLSRDDLEARMERAMREAQEESDEDGDGKDEDFEVGSMQSDEAEGSGEDDKNSELHSDSEDEALRAEPRSSQKNDYLPDHLFASAFSQLPSQDGSTAKAKVKKRAASPPTKKRKRVKKSTEVAVGYASILLSLPCVRLTCCIIGRASSALCHLSLNAPHQKAWRHRAS